MNKQIIEVEADSLKEAREQVKSQIPKGLHLLSEKVISDGKPKTIRGSSDTLEAAFEKARSKVPVGADITNRKELSTPEQKVITIEAFDEKTVRDQAKRQINNTARVKSVTLITPGKKGLLGIGKKPNCYEIHVFQQAVVEITYKEKAKICATLGDKTASGKQRTRINRGDRLFGTHKTSKKPNPKEIDGRVQPEAEARLTLTEKGKKQVMIRKDEGIITILIRKKLVDEFANSRSGRELGLPKKAVVAILAASCAGYTQDEAALFGQQFSDGKVMVKYLRSGSELVTDPSFDEPCYVVMSHV